MHNVLVSSVQLGNQGSPKPVDHVTLQFTSIVEEFLKGKHPTKVTLYLTS